MLPGLRVAWFTLLLSNTDRGAAKLVLTSAPVPGVTCRAPINSGPPHFVLKAAVAALNRWVRVLRLTHHSAAPLSSSVLISEILILSGRMSSTLTPLG